MIKKRLLRFTGILITIFLLSACSQSASGDTSEQEERITPVTIAEVTMEEERAMKKEITVVRTQSDVSAISGELTVGDQIVTSGQMTLADDNKVTIIEEAAN